jgi:hypothetical protein
MVEYGGGINNGPAGQVGGSGGGNAGGNAPDLGTPVDFFGSVGNVVNDTTAFLSAQPIEVLVAGIVVFFLGLIVLKRAF